MLTIRENLAETMRGGNPDRFVKQYEFLEVILEVPGLTMATPGATIKNEWGVTFSWPEDQIGAFPVHDDEHRLLKDVTRWKEVIKAPPVELADAQWAPAIEHANAVDRNEKYVAAFIAPGLFEMTHHMMGMEDAMMALYEEPECMHELINFLADHEIKRAAQVIKHIHPDACFHHDGLGRADLNLSVP